MELAEKTKERSTVFLAVMTLVVIGGAVLFFASQAFRQQREAEEQHLYLTTRAVYLAIESSVRRGPVGQGENRLSSRTADFFQALEKDGDVLFVGIIDEVGNNTLGSSLHGDKPIVLPPDMVADMRRNGKWNGRLTIAGYGVYVYGKRLEPVRGIHMSLRGYFGPPGFLVVGIDMQKHLGAYAGFRKNVFFQALYILAAAFITWGLGVRFMSRREQAKKAVALELFQAKLLDNLPDGLITLGPENTVRSANPAAMRILKRVSHDVVGQPLAALPADIMDCVMPEQKSGNVFEDRDNWRHCAYEGAQLEVMALPLSDDAEHARLVIIRDRTALRNLEKSLADAEKLAAVGTLAAGVAHEVRNPLSSLRGFAQYFVKKLAGRRPEEEYAKTMVREADRLNRVITDLLFLGRTRVIAPREVALAPLMRDIIALLRFDLELRNIEPQLDLDAKTVFADSEGLKQAMLNLLLNSLDALKIKEEKAEQAVQMPLMPSPAHLPARSEADTGECRTDSVAAANSDDETWYNPALPRVPDPLHCPPLVIASGHGPGGVWIEVRDTGCGMDSDARSQAFEAFFTNKEHGTGLGLALVQRTMLDHGGSAHIATTPCAGCAVRLVFPHKGGHMAEGGHKAE